MIQLENYSIVTNGSEHIAIFIDVNDDIIHIIDNDYNPKLINKSDIDDDWEVLWVCDRDEKTPYLETLKELTNHIENNI